MQTLHFLYDTFIVLMRTAILATLRTEQGRHYIVALWRGKRGFTLII